MQHCSTVEENICLSHNIKYENKTKKKSPKTSTQIKKIKFFLLREFSVFLKFNLCFNLNNVILLLFSVSF